MLGIIVSSSNYLRFFVVTLVIYEQRTKALDMRVGVKLTLLNHIDI